MNERDFIEDSNGKAHLRMRFIMTANDVLGREVRVAVDQINVDTPCFEDRLMTTGHVFKGGSVPYVGSTLHNPQDQFSYKDGFVWALYRAGLAYVYNHNDAALRKFRKENSASEVQRKVRAWARRLWFEMKTAFNVDPDKTDRDAWDEAERMFAEQFPEAAAKRAKLEKMMQDIKDMDENATPEELEIALGEALHEMSDGRIDASPRLDPFKDEDTDRYKALNEKLEELSRRANAIDEDNPDEDEVLRLMEDLLKVLIEA